MENKNRPKAAVGVAVLKDGKLLVAKRKGNLGDGEWAVPGGHIEFGESLVNCARREILEETGITIKNERFLCVANMYDHGAHYVVVGILADWKSGEPKIMEPEQCAAIGWYDLDKIPEPKFGIIVHCLEALKTGENYFDIR